MVFILFTLSACSPSFEEQFPDVYDKYTSLRPNKALAIAVVYNGGHAYGFSSGKETVEEAKSRALLECKARRQAYQIEKKCEIYMVNDKKIEN